MLFVKLRNGTGIFKWTDGIATFREYCNDQLIVERSVPIPRSKLVTVSKLYLPEEKETDLKAIVDKEIRIKKRRSSTACVPAQTKRFSLE